MSLTQKKYQLRPDIKLEFEGVGEEVILIWWTDERHGWLTLLRNLLIWAMRSPALGLSQRQEVFGCWMVAPRGTSSLSFPLHLSSVITHPSLRHRKQDDNRRQNKLWELPFFLNLTLFTALCSLTFVIGFTPVSMAQRTSRWCCVALLHTQRHKHSSWENNCSQYYSKNRFVFHRILVDTFLPPSQTQKKKRVWKYFTPGRVSACSSSCCRVLVNLHAACMYSLGVFANVGFRGWVGTYWCTVCWI